MHTRLKYIQVKDLEEILTQNLREAGRLQLNLISDTGIKTLVNEIIFRLKLRDNSLKYILEKAEVIHEEKFYGRNESDEHASNPRGLPRQN